MSSAVHAGIIRMKPTSSKKDHAPKSVHANMYVEDSTQEVLPPALLDHQTAMWNDSIVVYGGSEKAQTQRGDVWIFSTAKATLKLQKLVEVRFRHLHVDWSCVYGSIRIVFMWQSVQRSGKLSIVLYQAIKADRTIQCETLGQWLQCLSGCFKDVLDIFVGLATRTMSCRSPQVSTKPNICCICSVRLELAGGK